MKSNELMIGDWVMCSDPMPFRITELTNDDPWWIAKGDDGFNVDLGDIKPIPLTAEMLKANGFVVAYSNGEDFNQMSYKDEDGFATAYIYDKIIEIKIVGYNELPYRKFDAAIHSVHELQHILRDCGMNELANNFKI